VSGSLDFYEAAVGAMLAWRTERSEAAKIKVCPQCFLGAVEH